MPIEKSSLRRTLKRALRNVPPAARADASARIMAHLEALVPATPPSEPLTIAAFLPLPAEPNLTSWYQAVHAAGHTLAFPLIIGPGLMEFRQPPPGFLDPQSTALKPGPHRVLEPDPARCPRVANSQIDWVLVPGLAFAAGGARLGRGAGFYDRWLAGLTHHPLVIGIAFEVQILTALPMMPHDRQVDHIVTENGWLPGGRGVPDGCG